MVIMKHKDNRPKEPFPSKQRSRREGSSFSQDPGHYLSLLQRLTKEVLGAAARADPGGYSPCMLPACLPQSLSPKNKQRFICCSAFPASKDAYLSFPGSSLQQEPCWHFPVPLNKGDITDHGKAAFPIPCINPIRFHSLFAIGRSTNTQLGTNHPTSPCTLLIPNALAAYSKAPFQDTASKKELTEQSLGYNVVALR